MSFAVGVALMIIAFFSYMFWLFLNSNGAVPFTLLFVLALPVGAAVISLGDTIKEALRLIPEASFEELIPKPDYYTNAEEKNSQTKQGKNVS